MTDIELNNNLQKRTLGQWLFNPFQFVAGGNALFLGLVIMLAAAFLGSLGNLHFDGVIDLHVGKPAPLWFFMAEVLIDWLCLSIVLLITAFFVSRSSFRIIDVFGTQALARTPYLAALLVIMSKGFNRFAEYLAAKGMQQPATITIESTDILLFIVGIVVVLSMLVWMVALMYRAYGISCNIKGGKAIISFIAGLIIAEILSIVTIWQLALRTGLR